MAVMRLRAYAFGLLLSFGLSAQARWVKRITNAPGDWHGRAVAFDDTRDRVLLYGGLSSAAVSNDLWSWDGVRWRLVSTGGANRYDAKMAFDSNRGVAVVCGGVGSSGRVLHTSEWDGAAWKNIAAMPGPGGRIFHTMAYDSKRARVMSMALS